MPITTPDTVPIYAHSSLDPNFQFPSHLSSSSGGSDKESLDSRNASGNASSVASHEKRHDSITALPQFPDSSDSNEEAVETKPGPLKIIKEPAKKLKQTLSPTGKKTKSAKQNLDKKSAKSTGKRATKARDRGRGD